MFIQRIFLLQLEKISVTEFLPVVPQLGDSILPMINLNQENRLVSKTQLNKSMDQNYDLSVFSET